MKKRLVSLAVSLAMVSALTVPTFAAPLLRGDPNECPYCGIGSVVTTVREGRPQRVNENPVDCRHGSPKYDKDSPYIRVDTYEERCTVCDRGATWTKTVNLWFCSYRNDYVIRNTRMADMVG